MNKELLTEIKIDGVVYFVRYGTISMIEFGRISGITAGKINDLANMQLDQLYQLYYSGLVAGCKIAKVPCLTYEDFLLATEKDDTIMDTLRELRNPDQGN